MGRGFRLEDVARGKKIFFEQTCVVYLIVRPSVGPGLRLANVFRGKKMNFEARRCILSKLVFLLNCKAFGGSRVQTRRCSSRQEDFF